MNTRSLPTHHVHCMNNCTSPLFRSILSYGSFLEWTVADQYRQKQAQNNPKKAEISQTMLHLTPITERFFIQLTFCGKRRQLSLIPFHFISLLKEYSFSISYKRGRSHWLRVRGISDSDKWKNFKHTFKMTRPRFSPIQLHHNISDRNLDVLCNTVKRKKIHWLVKIVE